MKTLNKILLLICVLFSITICNAQFVKNNYNFVDTLKSRYFKFDTLTIEGFVYKIEEKEKEYLIYIIPEKCNNLKIKYAIVTPKFLELQSEKVITEGNRYTFRLCYIYHLQNIEEVVNGGRMFFVETIHGKNLFFDYNLFDGILTWSPNVKGLYYVDE